MNRATAAVGAMALLLGGSAAADERASLASAEALRALCEALRPLERVSFKGTRAEQKGARIDHQRERERLMKTDFTLELPWGGFTVGKWSAKEKTVTLVAERPFRAFDGALALFDLDRDAIVLDAVEGRGEALQQGLARGALTLTLVFRPAEAEACPCTIGKANNFTLAADLLSAELRAEGVPVARALRDGFTPLPAPGGEPTIEVRASNAPDCADCPEEIFRSVEQLQPAFERCYRDALGRVPTLEGSVVFAVESSATGPLAANAMADTVLDANAVACLKKAIGSARAAKAGRSTIVVELERKPAK